MPATSIASVPDIELVSGEQLYLLLDGARIAELERVLFEQDDAPAYQPIYLYAPWDSLREVSPCLVCATPKLLDWFIQNREPSWGYLLSSRLALLSLAERLRALIEVESPYGSRILFKLAMPESMWRLFIDDEPWLWLGMSQVWIPVRQANQQVWWHKRASPELGKPVGKRFRLSDAQWARLGEVSWLHTLDVIRQHMGNWFPVRLQEQIEPVAWITYWAEWAYGKGFESERDLLLFFNVLGYLGSGWCEQDEYPRIKALITQPSAQTPSQRIEQAAELAEALSKKDQDA
ncbi:DUF4123 domain-containing protein [Aeromonas piscicola]|jgi:hypothetical protein|uniref:DUF4123 domain-containing protein n=1 Tax=Aeromonas piscicola TaxID=600645 RepID=A0ABT7Q973_9GAMM|nr:DUF4123 domain-containing protein [Aeromonas piscicola]MDM5130499.1 DUF4123 domain-containing protein [Aeromonas piscicola]